MKGHLYYTEYPTGTFQADDDKEALAKSFAEVVYRESDTQDGRPFIMLRDNITLEYSRAIMELARAIDDGYMTWNDGYSRMKELEEVYLKTKGRQYNGQG